MARIPTLLSFHALSNGREVLIVGQLARVRSSDLSFKSFGRRRTFRTLLSLYRDRGINDETITLQFESFEVNAKTDASGSFYCRHVTGNESDQLAGVVLRSSGEKTVIMNGHYSSGIRRVIGATIVVTDIDDTVLHSYVTNRMRQLRTLMFTPMERRKAVVHMKEFIQDYAAKGATTIYLSNSEQNLHPLIYSFLMHHSFPPGPLFLRQLRRLRDVFRYRRLPGMEVHKTKMLDELLPMFPDKEFVLLGDNTQHDLTIYLAAAEKHPRAIRYILIRKVIERPADNEILNTATPWLQSQGITIHYGETLPTPDASK